VCVRIELGINSISAGANSESSCLKPASNSLARLFLLPLLHLSSISPSFNFSSVSFQTRGWTEIRERERREREFKTGRHKTAHGKEGRNTGSAHTHTAHHRHLRE